MERRKSESVIKERGKRESQYEQDKKEKADCLFGVPAMLLFLGHK